MNITELKCSACNGTVKADEQNPNVVECEYCHTKFIVEWSRPGMPNQGDARLRQMPQKIAYEPISEVPEKKTGWKRGAALAVFFAVITIARGIYHGYYVNIEKEKPVFLVMDGKEDTRDMEREKPNVLPEESAPLRPTGLLARFAEIVFEKPIEEISENELSRIQWLEMRSTIDYRQVGYSFDDPQENKNASLAWVEFDRDTCEAADLSCLSAFSGLKRIGTMQGLSSEAVKGLSLSGISGYYESLQEIADLVEDPKKIRYLSLAANPISLQGLELFPNLETLILDSDQIDEVKNLIYAKSLKQITVDMYDGSMDFSSFGMMPWLEELSISSENLRDLSFISKMKELKSLSVEYGAFLSLEPLRDCPKLEELFIKSCDEIKDMSSISALTNLSSLSLELPYNCPQPDLRALSGMKKLYLESFDETGFLSHMPQLEELTLASCNISSASDFDGLTNLKKLKCSSFIRTDQDYRFISHLPSLEEVDLQGTVTYGDISGIFNLPALKRLNISYMACELNFDRIAENTVLEALSMDKIQLYKNVRVSTGGGAIYVDWDDVSFAENLSFFEKLKALTELSIRENKLTDISFVSSLSALRSIDFSDNYVTDLSPLAGLKNLHQVKCMENPISNDNVLGESVEIFR